MRYVCSLNWNMCSQCEHTQIDPHPLVSVESDSSLLHLVANDYRRERLWCRDDLRWSSGESRELVLDRQLVSRDTDPSIDLPNKIPTFSLFFSFVFLLFFLLLFSAPCWLKNLVQIGCIAIKTFNPSSDLVSFVILSSITANHGKNRKWVWPVKVPASRSPDEAMANLRDFFLWKLRLQRGDHDDQARKSLEEALAKAKTSANVAPVCVRLTSAIELHRAHSEEVDNQRRPDFQEGRGTSSIAIKTCRGDGNFGRSRGPFGISQGRSGGVDQRSITTFGQRRSRVSSDVGPGAQSSLMSILIDQRDTTARERWEPVQPIEAVTRDSRYGFRATRVGEASKPSPPKNRRVSP